MSNTILLAHSKETNIEAIRSQLGEMFLCDTITSPAECSEDLGRYSLVLLDQDFADNSGLDFISKVLTSSHLPVLVLSNPDDSATASEAMRLGAYNFIVKTGDYIKLLGFAIDDAIKRYADQQYLNNTIVQLKEKISTLESQLAKALNQPKTVQNASATTIPETPESRLIRDIIHCLKTGDINLPAYPEISKRFNDMVSRGESINEITGLLEKDPAVSSKLISVANSTYYRGMVPIKTLDQAVSRIGMAESRNYVELIMNRGLYMLNSQKYTPYLNDLWEHSLACAYACQDLSRTILRKNPSELFTMGLFHDLGKLLLTQIMAKLENQGVYKEEISLQMHQEIVDKNFRKFGECLLRRWKMAEEYITVALYCDDIAQAPKLTEELLIVSLSEKIVREMGYGKWRENEESAADSQIAKALKLGPDKIILIKESVASKMQAGLLV